MITLGLSKIAYDSPNEATRNPSCLRAALSEALVDTAAWCLSRSLHGEQLRSRELDPSDLLTIPSWDELGAHGWLERKRESYQRAVEMITRKRSTLVRDTNLEIADVAEVQSQGRLLLYEPLETVTDGAAEASSRGFFDIEDAPPWDTWFLCSESTIFCWIPEALIQSAQAGIEANPVDCVHWLDWSKL